MDGRLQKPSSFVDRRSFSPHLFELRFPDENISFVFKGVYLLAFTFCHLPVWKAISLSCVISWTAYMTPSVPLPLSFTPP